jgi:hypothetical protein
MTMNTFYEHHENSIRFTYRCFDRILINGLIQPFQQPERVVGFFDEGYATQSGESQLRMLGHFNRWLERQRMVAAAVTASTVDRNVRSRRKMRKAAQRRLCRALPRVGNASTRPP